MKKMLMGWLGILCLLVSCSEKKGPEYYAFQEEEDGKWGLISLDGEVLFSEEFKNRPTDVYNGCFLVKNKRDEWEFYTAEEKPKPFGDSYKEAGIFIEDVAPVVAKDQPISFIDKDGETAFVLDKVDGKIVSHCSNFSCGRANFKAGGYWGYIDTDGKVVIPAKYIQPVDFSDDVAVVTDKKYEKMEKEQRQMDVIDTQGNVLFSIKGTDYLDISGYFQDGVMFVKVGNKDDDDFKGALIDKTGKEVLEATDKLRDFNWKRGDKFIFNDGDACGIMNMEGEVVVRPKYDWITWATDDSYFGFENDDEEGWNLTAHLYNLDGEKLGKGEYRNAATFYDGYDVTFVQEDEEWILINKEGEDQKLKVDIYSLSGANADWMLESDFVDYDALLDEAGITAHGISDLSMEMTPREFLKIAYNIEIPKATAADTIADEVEEKAEDYKYTDSRSIERKASVVDFSVKVDYENYFAEPVKTIVNTDWWGNPQEREIVVGYRLRDMKPHRMKANFSSNGKLEGKMKELYKAAVKKYKGMGEEVKSGENGKIFHINEGRYICVLKDSQNVSILVGYKDLLEIDLD